MTPQARIAGAIALLDAIDAAGRRPADAVASGWFRARRFIGAGDRRAMSGLTWTVLRRRRRIDWWLARADAGAAVGGRLRVASHLLLDGARLDAVRRLFEGGRYAPGSLDPDETRVLERVDGHTLEHPAMPDAVRLEVPEWLLPRLAARFGAELEPELAALSAEAPLDLRVNLLRGSREEAADALARDGIAAVPTPFSPWGLRATGRHPVTAGQPFRDGLVEIQDEGSQLIALAVAAGADMRVCDLCAGAGGKTLALAAAMGNRGQIVACDNAAPRLEGAGKRLRRAGVHNVERHLLEPGDRWAKRRAGSFDRVLVDAPCTGTGTWRRNPDARLRLRPEDLDELVVKQATLLDLAARLVKPGGRLVYATCSVLDEENGQQVDRFLARNGGFAPIDLRGIGAPVRDGRLVLTPRRDGTDGFFAAAFARAAVARGEPTRPPPDD